MLILLSILAAAGAVGGVVRFIKATAGGEKRARLADWQAAASACGLTDVAVRGRDELTGRRGSLTVRLRAFVITGENRGTKISVEGVPRWLTIRPLDPDAPSVEGVPTGDLAFDAVLVVVGPELEVRAALDCAARRRHLELLVPRMARQMLFASAGVDPDVTVGEGRVATRRPDEPVQERTDRVRVALELLLAVAESWTSPVPAPERVAANVRRDPNPDVRLGNLTALLRDARQDPVVPVVLEGALTDADPEVRLTAAVASGRGGREALRAFVAEASTRDEPAARAIDALGEGADLAEVTDWLARAQRARKTASVAACLRHLARPGLPVPPALVDALIDEAPSVRETAARLLGRVGTSAAHVIELRRVAEMYARDEPLVRAVREAVASIQSRLVGADRGQLAVAPDAGELSLAEDVDGRVSPADEQDGR